LDQEQAMLEKCLSGKNVLKNEFYGLCSLNLKRRFTGAGQRAVIRLHSRSQEHEPETELT